VATERRRRPTGLCHACRGARWTQAKLCRRRTCPGYGRIWAGDQRRKQFVNLGHYGDTQPCDVQAQVVLGAVTAPGVEDLPWGTDHCAAIGEHQCSGLLGCRVSAEAATEWNRSAPKRWRDLHRQATIRCNRAGLRPWLLARVWEEQRRGVLHVHPVFAFSTPAEKTAARTYMRHLAELAPRYGFGNVERKLRPMEAKAAAAYLSSYFRHRKEGERGAAELGAVEGDAAVDRASLRAPHTGHGLHDARAAVSPVRLARRRRSGRGWLLRGGTRDRRCEASGPRRRANRGAQGPPGSAVAGLRGHPGADGGNVVTEDPPRQSADPATLDAWPNRVKAFGQRSTSTGLVRTPRRASPRRRTRHRPDRPGGTLGQRLTS